MQLRIKAKIWAKDHSVISRIELYRAVDETVKFILWVTAPNFKVDERFKTICGDERHKKTFKTIRDEEGLRTIRGKDKQTEDEFYDANCRQNPDLWDAYGEYIALMNYYNWASPDCLHVANDLAAAQKKEAQSDTQNQEGIANESAAISGWMWISAPPGEDPAPDNVEMGSRVLIFEDTHVGRKLSRTREHNEKARASFRAYARQAWVVERRKISKVQLAKEAQEKPVAITIDREPYSIKFVERAISDLNPNRKSGRRPVGFEKARRE